MAVKMVENSVAMKVAWWEKATADYSVDEKVERLD